MTLDKYLRDHPITAAEFAEKIGVSGASVARIRKNDQNISLVLAQKIVAATGGKVTLEDLAGKAAA